MKSTLLINNEHGAALIIGLLVFAVLSTIGFTALFLTTTNQTIVGNYKKQAQAFYVAEAGRQMATASLKDDMTWRGGATDPVYTDLMGIGGGTARYTVEIFDPTNDGSGTYNALLPSAHVMLVSVGQYFDSTQTVEQILSFAPNDGSLANSPYAAVITTGGNTGSGPHVVNGYNNNGVLEQSTMVLTNVPQLPTVNESALKTFADFSFASLGNTEVDNTLYVQTDFWKDHPTDTQPYIIHVSGDLDISGDKDIYGIIFVEGTSVILSGAVRVHGVIYAPYATIQTVINGGGSPGDQPVMGQVICGSGGIHASGNHADVQLVEDYVDAFNNWGGNIVDIKEVAGSWRQY